MIKRILSVVCAAVLSLALSLGTAAAEPMVRFDYVPVFDSADRQDFLGGTANATPNGIYIGNGGFSDNILEKNEKTPTYLTDFQWQFTLKAENTATANTAFCFHVNEQSDTSSYENRKNLFSVTLYGSDYSADKANFQVANALVVEYPNSSVGAMRPFKYKTDQKPWKTDSASYIKLDDTKAEPINIEQNFTVNIKMNGNEIILSAWAEGDTEKRTYRELTVPMHRTAVETVPSGDFKVLSAKNSGNLIISDMQISNYTLVKNENYAETAQGNQSFIFDVKYLYIALAAIAGVIVIITVILMIHKKSKKGGNA